jgi:hypothetical protein
MAAMMPGMTKNQVAAHAAKKQKRGLQVKCGLELTGPILEKKYYKLRQLHFRLNLDLTYSFPSNLSNLK